MKIQHPDLKILGKYINSQQKILVEDSLGIQYNTLPNSLVMGKVRSIESAIDKNYHFIKNARRVLVTKYDYSKVKYINSKSHIKISCPTHGIFLQAPQKHIGGSGCQKCVGRNKTNQEFIDQCDSAHEGMYTYPKTEYTGVNNKIIVTCGVHGDFEIRAHDHLNGIKGCSKCFGATYDTLAKTEPDRLDVKLYLLKCSNSFETFYKIGLTRNVERRINEIPYDVTVLLNDIGPLSLNYKIEQHIISMMRELGRTYIPKIKFSGYTECFMIESEIMFKILMLFNPYKPPFSKEELEAAKRRVDALPPPIITYAKEGDVLPF